MMKQKTKMSQQVTTNLKSCFVLLQLHDDAVEFDLILTEPLVQSLHLQQGVPE